MLTLAIVLAASAAAAGHAHAHPHPYHQHARADAAIAANRLSSRSYAAMSPFEHGNLLIKRQTAGEDVGSALGEFPESCIQQCTPYVEGGARCSGLLEGSNTASQSDVLSCACQTDFMTATLTCMQCAPTVFEASDGYTARSLLSAALAQCECMGRKVEGIDPSVLPGEDDGLAQEVLNACSDNPGAGRPIPAGGVDDAQSTPNNGTEPLDDGQAGIPPAAGGSNTPVGNQPVREDEEANDDAASSAVVQSSGTPAAGGIAVTPTLPSSVSAQPTGAAFAIQSQHILALLVATLASSLLF